MPNAYTVILAYPEHTRCTGVEGPETYMTSVDADSVPEAIEECKAEMIDGNDELKDPDEIVVVAVMAGNHPDINDQG